MLKSDKQLPTGSDLSEIRLEDYDYPLTEDRIAQFPLENRESSKLLCYEKGIIRHNLFSSIPDLLPPESLLILNETRVIPARLFFRKSSGALIEVLLLNPVSPSSVMSIAMNTQGEVTWKCMIRNLKKWKDGDTLETVLPQDEGIILKAEIKDRENQLVTFTWDNRELRFSEILESSGQVPLPPYMRREPVPEDKKWYQTVYSRRKGAVAAPTAGLHFTDRILEKIKKTGHQVDFLTLHVGAGTFQPIREENIREHPMHSEQIIISKKNIKSLLEHRGPVVAVGTTSMRTLESLYWYGVKLIMEGDENFIIDKLYPYSFEEQPLPSKQESLKAIYRYMDSTNRSDLIGETGIFIFPGYAFKICEGLVTNFHIPRSTLILLVSAFVGDDWRKIYSEAMDLNYRFLSYGDSSLLLP